MSEYRYSDMDPRQPEGKTLDQCKGAGKSPKDGVCRSCKQPIGLTTTGRVRPHGRYFKL